jgi:hypothetical protein
MSDFETEPIPLDDLRESRGEILAGADVIIAVDADAGEEVIYGKWDLELAAGTALESDLAIVRVEIESGDDLDELRELIDQARDGEIDDA